MVIASQFQSTSIPWVYEFFVHVSIIYVTLLWSLLRASDVNPALPPDLEPTFFTVCGSASKNHSQSWLPFGFLILLWPYSLWSTDCSVKAEMTDVVFLTNHNWQNEIERMRCEARNEFDLIWCNNMWLCLTYSWFCIAVLVLSCYQYNFNWTLFGLTSAFAVRLNLIDFPVTNPWNILFLPWPVFPPKCI